MMSFFSVRVTRGRPKPTWSRSLGDRGSLRPEERARDASCKRLHNASDMSLVVVEPWSAATALWRSLSVPVMATCLASPWDGTLSVAAALLYI